MLLAHAGPRAPCRSDATSSPSRRCSQAELDETICWLTGFTPAELSRHIADDTTFEQFFAAATLAPAADKITGVVCGVRVEQLDDPLMQKIRYLDKLVDELAKGRPLTKVIRT